MNVRTIYTIEMRTSKGWEVIDDYELDGLNRAINAFRAFVLSPDGYDYRLTTKTVSA